MPSPESCVDSNSDAFPLFLTGTHFGRTRHMFILSLSTASRYATPGLQKTSFDLRTPHPRCCPPSKSSHLTFRMTSKTCTS